jgi:DNA-binding GntR family transcriptional regulator
MNNLKELRQQASLAEAAYVVIRQRIESGEIGPGVTLKEADVAASLDMGRTPVRESLQRLRAEGLLVHSTKGYVVLELSVRDILNVFQVRSMLEAGAARQAARQRTRVDLARMIEALDYDWTAAKDGNLLAAMIATDFYTALVGASKNRFLEGNLQSVRLLTIPYFRRIAFQAGVVERCHQERLRIYEAIESGNVEAAEQASREHFRNIMWTVLHRVQNDSPELIDNTIVWPPGQREV